MSLSPGPSPAPGEALRLLQLANLIRPGEGAEREEYRFKHSLVQETAYAMLLRERRVELHRQVARAIERLTPSAATAQPALLAYHYYQGGEDAAAFQHALRAAEAAGANYAYVEALAHYDLALDAGSRLEYGAARRSLRAAYLGKGKVLEISGDHSSAKSVFRQMLEVGVGHADRVMEAEALNRLATLALVTDDPTVDAESAMTRALELARQANAPLLTSRTLWNLGLRERFRDPLQADSYFLQALEITRSQACLELPLQAGVADIEAHVLIDMMVSGLTSGRTTLALERGRDALAAFRRLDDQPMIADALAGLSLIHHYRGEFEAAIALSTEAHDISERIDSPWSRVYSGWIQLSVLGDRAEWESVLAQGPAQIERAGHVPFLPFRVTLIGIVSWAWLELGDSDRALDLAQQAEAVWNGQPQPGWDQWTRAIRARVHLTRGEVEAASRLLGIPGPLRDSVTPNFQELYRTGPTLARLALEQGRIEAGLEFAGELIARMEAESTLRYAAEMRLWRGKLHAAAEDLPAAEADLSRAVELLVPMGARALVWPALEALAETQERLGRTQEAAERRRQTAAEIQGIAANLRDPVLRGGFLARPDVAAALAAAAR